MAKCPCCNEAELEEVSDKEKYCPKCDLTFSLNKGKVKVQPEEAKGRMKSLEENFMILSKRVEDMGKQLFGDDEETPLW